jgi:hypothetical protein
VHSPFSITYGPAAFAAGLFWFTAFVLLNNDLQYKSATPPQFFIGLQPGSSAHFF